MMRGNTVLTQLIKMELMAARRDSVTKSPRKEATGGAMLSEGLWSERENNCHRGTNRGHGRIGDRVRRENT